MKRLSWEIMLAFMMTLAHHAGFGQGGNGSYLSVNGGRIYYEEAGSGESIVLIHDGMVSSCTWDGEWAGLSKHFHAIRYDRRGFGLSDTPAVRFSQSDDLLALLEHLGVKHVTLVGCSSGGGVAINFALDHPEMVDRLILIGSVLQGMLVTNVFVERGTKINMPLLHDDFESVAIGWSNEPTIIAADDTAGKRRLYNDLMKYPRNLKYTGEYEIRPEVPAIERIGGVCIPTLILVGEQDHPDVHAIEGAIQAGIPGARREMVKGAAHLVPLEKPDLLVDRIVRFVDSYPRVSLGNDILQRYAGKYGSWTQVLMEKDHLVLRYPREKDIPLFPISQTRFRCFLWGEDATIEFEKDPAGGWGTIRIEGEYGTRVSGQRK